MSEMKVVLALTLLCFRLLPELILRAPAHGRQAEAAGGATEQGMK